MHDNTGYIIVGLIILLFIIGTGSLLIDSLLNRTKDISPPKFEPEPTRNKTFATYTVNFLEDGDELSIL